MSFLNFHNWYHCCGKSRGGQFIKESSRHGYDNSWCSVELWQAYSAFFCVMDFLCLLVVLPLGVSFCSSIYGTFSRRRTLGGALSAEDIISSASSSSASTTGLSHHRSYCERGCIDCVTCGRSGTLIMVPVFEYEPK